MAYRRYSKSWNNLGVIAVLIALTYLFILEPMGISITEEYIGFIPSLILFVFGVYGVKMTRIPAAKPVSFLVIGLSFAFFTGELNSFGVIIPDILTDSFTLQYLQALLVVLSTIIGLIIM